MSIDPVFAEVALVPNSTYNYSNSSVFYSLVNYSFLNYYQKVVRKSQEWLDGFDPAFHKASNGIFSSRIGAKITNGITKQIFGRGLIFVKGNGSKDNETVDYVSHKWQDKAKFPRFVKNIIGYTVSLGTSLGKLNVKWKNGKQELWCQALRQDYFYFSVDSEMNLREVTCYIRAFQTTEASADSYVLVEKRYFKKEKAKFTKEVNGKMMQFEKLNETVDVPYAVYRIYKINNTSENNSLAANKGDGLDFKSLPTEIKDMLNKEYSAVVIGKEQKLPFVDSLGCYLFFNEGGDVTHPSMPFGRALMFDCLTDFMEYDLERSFAIRDLFNSKGVVGIPKALSQGSLIGSMPQGTPGQGQAPLDNSAGNFQAAPSNMNPFGQKVPAGYELVEGLDPNTQKPIISQFEIRAVEHETKQNNILKSIATTIGMSPRVIASYLVQGNEKTAEQTHSEDDTITEWIKVHRQDYVEVLNVMLEDVLNFYGKPSNVEVRFASDGLVSNERQLEIIGKKLELGIIDLEDAVREVYPDLDEIQLQDKIAKAKAQKAENERAEQNQFDEFYGDDLGGNNEEQPKPQDQFNE